MAATMLLDRSTWDLLLDANGNIALATEPYSLAQDAASAIKTLLGECYWDSTVGVPWLQQILGKSLSISLIKQHLVDAALTVPDVSAAQVFISSVDGRMLSGQVQVTQSSTGKTATATFTTINPQGM